jgi:PAS domain S-box-containing protein
MSPLDLRTAVEGTNGSERQLRAIVDIIPIQIWFGRHDGTTEFLHQRWLDYSGLSADEALGWERIDAICPEDQELVREVWRRTPCAGEAVPL